LGNKIARMLKDRNYETVILSRNRSTILNGHRCVKWDARSPGDWTHELEGAKAIFNFVGKRASSRPTRKNREEIIRSRVESTWVIGNAIVNAKVPPGVWINAGAIQIYPDIPELVSDENSAIEEQGNFLTQGCREWEAAFDQFNFENTRMIFLRIGTVLGKEGYFAAMKKLARFGLGRMGSGKQFLSWIHEEDLARLVWWLMDKSNISGKVNGVAPEPVIHQRFLEILKDKMGGKQKMSFKLGTSIVKSIAKIVGTDDSLLLGGRRVIPKRLLQAGYEFQFPVLEDAIADLVSGS